MLFLDDTLPIILTENGDDITTERKNDLCGDNVTDLVEMVIPTKRTAQAANLTILTVNDTTGAQFEFVSQSASIKPYKVTAIFNFNVDMPCGQYHFILSDIDGELQRGLMQVGMRTADVQQYKPEIKTVSYERR